MNKWIFAVLKMLPNLLRINICNSVNLSKLCDAVDVVLSDDLTARFWPTFIPPQHI